MRVSDRCREIWYEFLAGKIDYKELLKEMAKLVDVQKELKLED